jgi:cysteine desulfurase/selenocysteine lyase
MVDGAQGLAHTKTDVQNLNCDFLAFSAHKMLGPTGVGVLYTKEEMSPLLFGGGIVKEVTETESTFLDGPEKFDAGTANIADVIAFGQALEYLKNIGLTKIHEHEVKLAKKCQEMLSKYPEVKLYCPSEPTGIISFTIDSIHPHDIAQVFDEFGVCIRAGHHCNQPLMKKLGITATARISFYLYNTEKDIEIAEEALQKCIQIFK